MRMLTFTRPQSFFSTGRKRKCCDCLEGTANKSNCGYLCQVDIQKRLHAMFLSFKLFWRLKFFDKRVSIFFLNVLLLILALSQSVTEA